MILKIRQVGEPALRQKSRPLSLEEIRSQYNLTYVLAEPSGKGTYHRIRVEVVAPEQKDVKVSVRSGYVERK